MTTSPTILLGLGGIGSQIVQRVYGLIPAAERGDVLVHAFDTNVNDIKKLGKLKGAVTQVSAPWTVGQYLERADPSVHDWFPSDIRILHRKNLTEGAGQIRCVSRLAYRATMDTGRLEPLRQRINGILEAASAGEITSVRVMVANSIAGGTGAGIFLQVALFMRELLDETFGRQNVLIRGAFVLPDVLVNSGVIKDDREIPSVRANSYACLKELDAIARIASTAGGSLADAPTVDLEYRPNQVDLEGRLDHAINEKHLPFDFCFLFDFENTAGQNLGSIQNYLEQVSRAVHAQLFSPMAPNHFSQEDNQILGLVSSRGTSRYCGAGIARIEYPYRDILQYGALRWATDALAGEWLRPDLDFDEELRAYERDQQAGVNREPPDRRSRFIFAVDNYARGESPAPAFVRIQKAAHLVSQKGDLGQPKAEAFLAALESEIERLCGGDEEIARLESECRVDEARLGNRDHTSREVDRVEDALARLHDRVLRFVDETRTFVSNRAVLRDCDEANPGRSDESFRLNTWLFARPAPVHPLAARYILYQLDLLIDQRLRSTGVDSFGDRVGALEGENQQLLANLKKYAEAYNLAETDVLETAQERARNSLRQPFWARHIQTDLFKEFVEEYREKSTRQLAGLSQYKRSKLLEHVLSDIQRAVRTMMSQWERYFGNLRDVRNGLMGEAELLADVHERSGDPSVVYVLATRRDKVRMWDEVRRKYLATDLPVELYRQMLIGQFRRFCEARQSGRTGLERDEKVDAMFRADVVDWCRAQLEKEDSLDRDVVSALALDADTIGADREEHVASQLRGVDNLARPWAPAHTRQAPIEFWGLHPDAGRRLSAARREDIVAQLIESAAYSRYEIVRYRAQYGMRAEDFPKFSRGGGTQLPGVYFRAYADRVRSLTEAPDRFVTPHLDKRWHLPAYLPDLNAAVEREDQARLERAFLLGMIHGYIRVTDDAGRKVWMYRSGKQTALIKVAGRDVVARLPDLLEALGHNPGIVKKVIELAEFQSRDDMRDHPQDLDRHQFLAGCLQSPNILERLLAYPSQAIRDDTVLGEAAALLGRLLEELHQHLRDAYGAGREPAADAECRRVVERLIAESPTWQEGLKNPDRVFDAWQAVVDGFRDTLER